MRTVPNKTDLKKLLRSAQSQGLSVGFVPTMGALHEGHLSLVRRSKKDNAVTVASIFVNPTQFGPNEDFERYPRDPERDQSLLSREKVDYLYAPSKEDIYAPGSSTYVDETELSQVMCGAFRPGHFRGVCTVVFRLFQIVQPDRAYFGQKDAQQLRIIEKMAEDLGLDIRIIGCPTLREGDGLAMSSRNAYLSEEERTVAPQIYAALKEAQSAFTGGERSVSRVLETAKDALGRHPAIQTQYLELRRWRDLRVEEAITEKSVLAFAGYLGKTRLIDNVILTP
ncbi:MAG: pantoate--beta-alanine ligase [Pseudomonadota bacterium]